MDVDLRSLRSDCLHLVPRLLEAFGPGADRRRILQDGDEIVSRLYLLAVAALLVEGDSQRFLLNLVRCAENGLRVLRLLAHRGLERPPASRNVPLLAALAAGDHARARAIARLSRQERDREAGEYADEFLWARAVQLLVAPDLAPGTIGQILDGLVALDPGAFAERAGAVRAIEGKDPGAFEAALAGAARTYEIAVEKRAAAFGTPVTAFAPHRFLWLEGLALLRLGEQAGLHVEGELRFCPRLARVRMLVPYEGDYAIGIGDLVAD